MSAIFGAVSESKTLGHYDTPDVVLLQFARELEGLHGVS